MQAYTHNRGFTKEKKYIISEVREESVMAENMEITLQDTFTLNTFCAKVEIKQQYLPLLLKWIGKRKFSVLEQALENTVSLRIEMFNFSLV